MLYKRQLICYIKDNFDIATPHSACRELRTTLDNERHTLLAENLGQCNATLCLQRTLILAYDATASTDSLSLLKCKKSCPKLF